MGEDAGKLEPPKLFGRKKARTSPGPTTSEPAAQPGGRSTPGQAAGQTGEPAAGQASEPAAGPAAAPLATQAAPRPVETAAVESPTQRVRRPLRVNGHLAALVAGVIAGVLLAGGTWAAESANDSADNTRVAAAMLLAIFVISVVAGSFTLRLLHVPSPGSIAFLGTALVAVLAVVALGSHLDDAVGAVAVAAMSAVAYPLTRWVTVRFIDA